MEYTFYKLSIGDKCYVGSTIDFDYRMKSHNYSCNNKNNNLKVYQYVRQNGGFQKVDIMIIDKIIYNDKEQAREMETKYMLMFNAELNSCYPKRSKKDYYKNNKDTIDTKHKKYNETNKDKIIIKTQQYYEEHKKEIAETTRKYREENKERIRLKDRERKSEKVVCDICGKMMCRGYISKHKKSQH